ncbi:hypothetical protein P280DRAFT_522948 [Massarina eburnea CBS 473.64]|uniref:Uncharacterized protein n=1 Tax=Massarina eburnea CBS 473.64 TaxID=1395130 RepID=A0A6A6RM64_9PLEO|nr:hypothetical protein P280DRAFT_522948 [Massarina eburnea CBS 473.64]
MGGRKFLRQIFTRQKRKESSRTQEDASDPAVEPTIPPPELPQLRPMSRLSLTENARRRTPALPEEKAEAALPSFPWEEPGAAPKSRTMEKTGGGKGGRDSGERIWKDEHRCSASDADEGFNGRLEDMMGAHARSSYLVREPRRELASGYELASRRRSMMDADTRVGNDRVQ